MINIKLSVVFLIISGSLLFVHSDSSTNLKLGFDLVEDTNGGSSLKLRSFKESKEDGLDSRGETSSDTSSSEGARKNFDDDDLDLDEPGSFKTESFEKIAVNSDSGSGERRERSTMGLRSAESREERSHVTEKYARDDNESD